MLPLLLTHILLLFKLILHFLSTITRPLNTIREMNFRKDQFYLSVGAIPNEHYCVYI